MSTISAVEIRPYQPGDAQALWEAARESFSEVWPWLPWCHEHYSIEEARAWLDDKVSVFRAGNEFEFAIVGSDGRYLGGCGLNQIDWQHKRANLGYWVRSSAMKQGVAPTAVGLLREWGFRNTDLLRLELVIAVGNSASCRVAQKSGAEFEGILRSRLLIHGVPHDANMFSFTRAAP